MIKWYSLDNILKHEAQYYMILGERSNGKSFALLKYCLDKYFKEGKTFGYVKRYEEDIKKKYMDEVFNPLDQYVLDNYDKKIKFYQGKFYVYDKEKEGKLVDCECIGHAFSIANVNRTKGTSYPNIDTILFEEFMSIDCSYLNDEINLFLNLVSTIARNRTTVKVFMLANTISKYTPYFSALNIKAHRIPKGEILIKKYTDELGFNSIFAIERTENVNVFNNEENKSKTVYNIFGTSGVGSMITTGEFETHKYFTEKYGYSLGKNIGKKYKTDIAIQFEDYFYRVYIINDYSKYISAFREIKKSSINDNNTSYIINGKGDIKNVVNINNFMKYNVDNDVFRVIYGCINERDLIFNSDDDGENVINGFRLAGVTYTHK